MFLRAFPSNIDYVPMTRFAFWYDSKVRFLLFAPVPAGGSRCWSLLIVCFPYSLPSFFPDKDSWLAAPGCKPESKMVTKFVFPPPFPMLRSRPFPGAIFSSFPGTFFPYLLMPSFRRPPPLPMARSLPLLLLNCGLSCQAFRVLFFLFSGGDFFLSDLIIPDQRPTDSLLYSQGSSSFYSWQSTPLSQLRAFFLNSSSLLASPGAGHIVPFGPQPPTFANLVGGTPPLMLRSLMNSREVCF